MTGSNTDGRGSNVKHFYTSGELAILANCRHSKSKLESTLHTHIVVYEVAIGKLSARVTPSDDVNFHISGKVM